MGHMRPESFNIASGTAFVRADPGQVDAVIRPGAEITTSLGQLYPGTAAAVADAALGAAVFSMVPAGWGSMTVQLRLDFLPHVTDRADSLLARAHARHIGAGTGLSMGEIVDDRGNLRAYGTARSVVQRAHPTISEDAPAQESTPLPAPPDPPAMPLERHAPEVGIPVGLQNLMGSPLVHRLRMEVVDTTSSTVTVRVPSTPDLSNSWGAMHGGAVSFVADTAMAAALHALLPGGSAIAPMDLSLTFVRPVVLQGDIECTAELVHGGQRLAVVRSLMRNPDGRVAVAAASTAFVITPR
jgi:uncharacterized protein (TIGR00369 family)